MALPRSLVLPLLLLTGCGALQQAGLAPAKPAGLRSADRLPCAPRREMVDLLEASRAQTPVAMGLASTGGMVPQASVLEILASRDGLAWTAILTAPNGLSCAFAGGEGWQQLSETGVSY